VDLLRVEFHCHTIASKDCLTSPRKLVQTCQKKGIDRVVVTDHNTIRGALKAKEIDPQRVIVGEEIMTTQGELLAAYVTEEVPRGLPPMQAIERLRSQGAFISVSHPFDEFRNGGWKLPDLEQILPHVDAIETYNARCLKEEFNVRAQAFAKERHLAGTVGSDAHTAFELGQAVLLLDAFEDAASLKAVIPQGQPICKPSGAWVHLTSSFARWYKLIFPPKE
jgi:predicted metal-dependent phosphoesterase TrpH